MTSWTDLLLAAAIERSTPSDLWAELAFLCPTPGERSGRLEQVDKFKREGLPPRLMFFRPEDRAFHEKEAIIRNVCERIVGAFKRQLASGEITASGVPHGRGAREPIDSTFAASLDLDPFNNAMFLGRDTRFDAVLCSRHEARVQDTSQLDELLEFWRTLYGTDVADWPDNARLEDAARGRFGDVKQDIFRAALKKLGRKRGRPRKNK